MSEETPENTDAPRERLSKEYEDPHYHDEDEFLQADDVQPSGPRLASRGKAKRKLPPRHYDDADY
jgi:hypothetical protein